MLGQPMKGPFPVRKHPLYRRWSFMRQVCNNPRHADYKSYGGKGITVGKEFAEFWDFVDIIERKLGPPPNGRLSKLARKDQDGNYTIKNLCWDEAAGVGRRHKRTYMLKYKGKTRPLREWSEEYGINFATMASRIYRGWTPQQILGLKPGPKASARR
jgi:hypothetical protein